MKLIEDFLNVDRTTARVIVGSLGLALVVLFLAESDNESAPVERPRLVVVSPEPIKPDRDRKREEPSLSELAGDRARDAWEAVQEAADDFIQGYTRRSDSFGFKDSPLVPPRTAHTRTALLGMDLA